MSYDVQDRLTVHLWHERQNSTANLTVDQHVGAHAERLVKTGRVASVSAAFNEAMAEKAWHSLRWRTQNIHANIRSITRSSMEVTDQQRG